jgi:hypothetical protein
MRLNYGEGNGVRLAGRTSLNTARIAHTARKALSTLIYNILRGRYRPQLPTAGGSRSTATSNTDRGSNACESDVLQVFLLPQPRRGRCGRCFCQLYLMAYDRCPCILVPEQL